MPLFEANWPDAPTLLINAYTAGEALSYIRDALGEKMLYQLDELIELAEDSFLLTRRCGHICEKQILPRFQFCPSALPRLFLVERRGCPSPYVRRKRDRCVIVVRDLHDLPSLVLWHYDLLSEEESLSQAAVTEVWSRVSSQFQLAEIDTQQPGLLLSYQYCSCPEERTPTERPTPTHKRERE